MNRIFIQCMFCIAIVGCFTYMLFSNDKDKVKGAVPHDELLPLVLSNKDGIALAKNHELEASNKILFSVLDTQSKVFLDIHNPDNNRWDYEISLIRKLDKETELKWYQKQLESHDALTIITSNKEAEFCVYRPFPLKNTDDYIYVVLGIDSNYYSLGGRQALILRAFDLKCYCDLG